MTEASQTRFDARSQARPDAQLRVACVGLGYFSQFHLDAWDRIPEARMVGLCTLDRDAAEAAAARFPAHGAAAFDDLDAMLTALDPDVLDIITPPSTHADFVRKAARPGRAIICQKPFCQNAEEGAATAAAAKQAGALVVIHENFRFQPWHRAARSLIEAGALGDIYQATFRLRPGDGQGEDAYLARQPFFREMPRFLVRETAIHFIDTFRYLLGEATSVYADLRRLNPAIAGEDAGVILMRHESGAQSVIDGNRLSDHVAENRRKTMGEMAIEGSAGALRLDGDGRLFRRAFGQNEETEIALTYEDRGFGGDCVRALQAHVVAHLLEGASIENAADDYVRNSRIEAAAYASSAEGRRISLSS